MNSTSYRPAEFSGAIGALYREAIDAICYEDFLKLRRVEWLGRFFTFVGFVSAGFWVNPISVLCLSLGSSTRWMIAHQVLHRGYDRVPGIPHRYTSMGFAQGWRRYIDWFDWIYPKAWCYEHNVLHHRYTGEADDPNLVDPHTEFLRSAPVPTFAKYLVLIVAAMLWKVVYYAPSTFHTLRADTLERKSLDSMTHLTAGHVLGLHRADVRGLWLRCYLPYGLFHFVLLPGVFWFGMGEFAGLCFLANRVLAEIVSNVHAFLVILPNHTAPDLLQFDFHYDSKAEFHLCQILSTVNYHSGPVRDYLQFWLNYQIEHHLFPDLPMTAYAGLAPKVRAVCEEHGVPYKQASWWARLPGMARVVVGEEPMAVVGDQERLLQMVG